MVCGVTCDCHLDDALLLRPVVGPGHKEVPEHDDSSSRQESAAVAVDCAATFGFAGRFGAATAASTGPVSENAIAPARTMGMVTEAAVRRLIMWPLLSPSGSTVSLMAS